MLRFDIFNTSIKLSFLLHLSLLILLRSCQIFLTHLWQLSDICQNVIMSLKNYEKLVIFLHLCDTSLNFYNICCKKTKRNGIFFDTFMAFIEYL